MITSSKSLETPKNRRFKRPRKWIMMGICLALLLLAVTIYVRIRFHGEALANLVTKAINESIVGRLEIKSLEWRLWSMPKALTGGWVPAVAVELKIYDEFGELVVDVPELKGDIDIHPVLFGPPDIILRHLEVTEGGYCKIVEKEHPYAKPQFSRHSISLISAFTGKPRKKFSAGRGGSIGPTFNLHDYKGRAINVEVDFRNFQAQFNDVSTEGFLLYNGSDPIKNQFVFSLTPKATSGRYVQPPLVDVPLQNLDIETLTLLPKNWPSDNMPHDLVYKGRAESGPAEINAKGSVIDFWTDSMGGFHDLDLAVKNGGHIAAAMFEDELVRGDNLDFDIRVQGPNAAMTVKMVANDVDIIVPFDNKSPLELHVAHGELGLDLATDSGFIEETVITGAGGSAKIHGALHSNPSTYDLHAEILDPFDIRPFVTPLTSDAFGTKLSGTVHIFGTGEVQRFDHAKLRLGDARIVGHGRRTTVDKMLYLDSLKVDVGKTSIRDIKGQVDVAQDGIDVDMFVDSKDAPKWLRFFKASPKMAKRVKGKVNLSGSFTVPTISANLQASGVPYLGQVNSRLRFKEGQALTLHQTQSNAWGGVISVSGKIPMNDQVLSIDTLKAQGRSIDLSQVPVIGSFATGIMTFRASGQGRIDAPNATLEAELKNLSILGESYDDTRLELKTKAKGESRLKTRVVRQDGGIIDVDAILSNWKKLGGQILLKNIPISRLVSTVGESSLAGGDIDAEINLSGTLKAPTADGLIEAKRSWFDKTFLGNAKIDVTRHGPGVIHIDATLFQESLKVSGTINTRYPFSANLAFNLRRLELDRLMPKIATLTQTRSYVTGQIDWSGPLLVGVSKEQPAIRATLSEVAIVKDGVDDNDRPNPLRISNRSPIRLEWKNEVLNLIDDAVFEGPTGDIEIQGNASANVLNLNAKAQIPVSYFAPYTTKYFDGLDGTLDVALNITGRPMDPKFTGVVQIDKVSVKPTGQDARVELPAGRIEFNNQGLSLTGLSLVVSNQFSRERSELHISGGVQIKDQKPSLWAIVIDGTLSGEMLLALVPQALSSASGSADISIGLSGFGLVPNIDGTISFFDTTPLTLTPRGSGKELSFETGEIRFTDDEVELEGISGWVDDEGHITNLSGRFDIEDWQPTGVDIQLSATDLPFRIPKTLELLVNVENVHVVGGANDCPAAKRFSPECYEFAFEGKLEIADGRYIRYFNPILESLEPTRVVETTTPLHERYPIIANATLDLELNAQGFGVKNNVADIDMSGRLQIEGTVNNPTLDGEIQIDQGNFKIQGIRARFDQTDGNIIFDANKSFPGQTPTLNIRSESNFRDLDGQDHLVKLYVGGTIDQPSVDLSTQAGFNKGQTFVLIAFGRTPEAAREVILGDQGVVTQAGQIQGNTSTADSQGALQATNEVFKDLTGDFLNEIVGQKLKNFTSLDVANLKIGTASFGFYGEKIFSKSIRLHIEYDQTLRGQSLNTSLGYRANDSLSLDAEILRKTYDDPAQLDDSQRRLKTTWKFRWR